MSAKVMTESYKSQSEEKIQIENVRVNNINDLDQKQQKLNQGSQCPICLGCSEGLYYFGSCGHAYCKGCLCSYIESRMQGHQSLVCCAQNCENALGRNDGKYIFEQMPQANRKAILLYLKDMQNWRAVCQHCELDRNSLRVIKKCKKCKEDSIEVPPNMKKCPLCFCIIEKSKGCLHVKCVCTFQFCYHCEEEWRKDHICQDKLPRRSGIAYFLCLIPKFFIGIFLAILLLALFVVFVFFLCCLYACIYGLYLQVQIFEAIQKSTKSNIAKCLLFFLSCFFMPLLIILGAIPGFCIPLINICWKKQLFLDPHIVQEIWDRLFACLMLVKLI